MSTSQFVVILCRWKVKVGMGGFKVFCSLAVLNPRVGHTVDVLSPFISVLRHFD